MGFAGILRAEEFSGKIQKLIVIADPLKEFQPGEKFDYKVNWMGIPIGTASLHVKEIINRNGRDLYHVVAQAKTTGFFSKIYFLDDVMQSYIDKQTLLPIIYEEKIHEGKRKSEMAIEFNQTNGVAIYKDKNGNITRQIEIRRGVLDPLSCFYAFRALKVEKSGSYKFVINTDFKDWDVEVKVTDATALEIRKKGVFDTFVAEPKSELKNSALARNKTFIYFTADEKRIPIFIKTLTRKGIITANLQLP